MSIEERSVQSGSTEASSGKVGTAAEESSRVASDAAGSAKQLASQAAGQAGDVLAEAKQQLASLFGDTKSELQTQLDTRGSQAAQGLRSLSSQLQALGQGRTEEAGPLAGYVRDAQARVQGFATRLEQGGSQGLLEDATSFARRRPMVFLLGAAAAGFALGRVVRAAQAASQQSDGQSVGGTTGGVRGFSAAEIPVTTPDPYATPAFADVPLAAQGTYAEPAEAPYADHGSGVTER